MDFTEYLPEKLREQYEEHGTAITVLDKVLELFGQVLSGDPSSSYDFQAKLNELQHFWDSYELTDLTKLKKVLDPEGVVESIALANEACGSSLPDDSEKTYLMTIPLFNKMKGTIKGLTNILRLFGITVTVIPWYDDDYPYDDPDECSVIISAVIDSGCFSETAMTTVESIVRSLLDVCAIVALFEMKKSFETEIDIEEDFEIVDEEDNLCSYWDWRNGRTCCSYFCIANGGLDIYYQSPSGGARCLSNFRYDGTYVYKCGASTYCGLERVDVAIVDPMIRACSEIYVLDIEIQEGHTVRYTLEGSPDFDDVEVGDSIYVSDAYYANNNGGFIISAVSDVYKWIEVLNITRSDDSEDENDSTGCTATMAINVRKNTNREILGYNSPVRTPIYDGAFIPGVDLGDSAGDGSQYDANELIGSNWPKAGDYRHCVDVFEGYYSILNDDCQWALYDSDSIGDEYYLVLGDTTADGIPMVAEPTVVLENGVEMTQGTAGELGLGEWDYAEYDGNDTIIVKLSDGADPNTKADHYLEAGVKKDYCVDTLVTHAREFSSGPEPSYLLWHEDAYLVTENNGRILIWGDNIVQSPIPEVLDELGDWLLDELGEGVLGS